MVSLFAENCHDRCRHRPGRRHVVDGDVTSLSALDVVERNVVVIESSKTALDDEVDDVTSFSALDVVEIKRNRCRHRVV